MNLYVAAGLVLIGFNLLGLEAEGKLIWNFGIVNHMFVQFCNDTKRHSKRIVSGTSKEIPTYLCGAEIMDFQALIKV